jgi:hypothetical protein
LNKQTKGREGREKGRGVISLYGIPTKGLTFRNRSTKNKGIIQETNSGQRDKGIITFIFFRYI